jgi:Short C-terminal domain
MPGLLRGIARTAVVAGTASSVAGRVHHRQENKWAAQEQAAAPQQAEAPPPQQYQAAPPAEQAPAGPSTDDKLAQLKQLGELRDAGVLTDAEFEGQKGKILYGS